MLPSQEREIKIMVELQVQAGICNREIHKQAQAIAGDYPEPVGMMEIEEIILNEKARKWKKILGNYPALDLQSIGIDYSGVSVGGGMPKDVPESLVYKIAIDQAADQLSTRQLVAIYMHYVDMDSDIHDFCKWAGVKLSTAYYIIDRAVQQLVYTIEYDNLWIRQLIDRLSAMFGGQDVDQVTEIVADVYKKKFEKSAGKAELSTVFLDTC